MYGQRSLVKVDKKKMHCGIRGELVCVVWLRVGVGGAFVEGELWLAEQINEG